MPNRPDYANKKVALFATGIDFFLIARAGLPSHFRISAMSTCHVDLDMHFSDNLNTCRLVYSGDKFSKTTRSFFNLWRAHSRHNDDRKTRRANRPEFVDTVISRCANQSFMTRDFHDVETTWATPEGYATIDNVVVEEHTRRYSRQPGPLKQEDLSEQ